MNNISQGSPDDDYPDTGNESGSEDSPNKLPAPENEDKSLVDDLGITGTSELLFGKDGRIFSAAGRLSPVAEFTSDVVLLHPPQKPLDEDIPYEDILLQADEQGILLNELGQQRVISGAKFHGSPIYCLLETDHDSGKHIAACLQEGELQKLYFEGEPVTTDIIFKLRNKTHDGELSIYSDLSTEPAFPESLS